jgi:methionine sulfoxide reductase heme-binding subunit
VVPAIAVWFRRAMPQQASRPRASRRRATARLAVTGTLAAALVTAASLALAGGGTDGWRLAARLTARLSFAIFLVVYSTHALARLVPAPATRWMMRERRGLGLAFAGAHMVHLAALIEFFVVSQEPAPLPTVVLGGFGYVLVAAMAVTSNDAALRLLGPARWRRLHAVGLHYVWSLFVLTHALRIAAGRDAATHALLLAAALAALGLRTAGRRAARPHPSPPQKVAPA